MNNTNIVLEALYEIQRTGLSPDGDGLCIQIKPIMYTLSRVLFNRTEIDHTVKTWPLATVEDSYVIGLWWADESPRGQYMCILTHCMKADKPAPDYKAEYLGLRWHLLHHLINYFEDLVTEQH